MSWQEELTRDESGAIELIEWNIVNIIVNDPRFDGLCAYCEMHQYNESEREFIGFTAQVNLQRWYGINFRNRADLFMCVHYAVITRNIREEEDG